MTAYVTVTEGFDLDDYFRNYSIYDTPEHRALLEKLVPIAVELDSVIPGECVLEIQVHANPDWEQGNPDVSDSWCMLRVTQQPPIEPIAEPVVEPVDTVDEAEQKAEQLDGPPVIDGDAPLVPGDGDPEPDLPTVDGDGDVPDAVHDDAAEKAGAKAGAAKAARASKRASRDAG